MAYAPFHLHQFELYQFKLRKSPANRRQPESATALLIQIIKG